MAILQFHMDPIRRRAVVPRGHCRELDGVWQNVGRTRYSTRSRADCRCTWCQGWVFIDFYANLLGIFSRPPSHGSINQSSSGNHENGSTGQSHSRYLSSEKGTVLWAFLFILFSISARRQIWKVKRSSWRSWQEIDHENSPSTKALGSHQHAAVGDRRSTGTTSSGGYCSVILYKFWSSRWTSSVIVRSAPSKKRWKCVAQILKNRSRRSLAILLM